MSKGKLAASAGLAAALIAGTPSLAAADGLITPFVGANFGGNANFGTFGNVSDDIERRADFGVSIGWMGSGAIGVEEDPGFSPNFFENTSAPFDFGSNNVTTVMGNLIVGVPIGGQTGPGIRPFAVGGIGLMHSRIDGDGVYNDLETNDFGFNVGAGLIGFFSDHVGIRGDVRYFRSLQDTNPGSGLDLGLTDFDFWRGTVGVTFRFGND